MDVHRDETAASQYLAALAARIAAAYVAHTGPRAMLLTGSAAEGVSDAFSDLDLIVYYDDCLPTDAELAAARKRAHAVDFRVRVPRADGTYVEEFLVQGVECELQHTTIATWERQMDVVLRDCVPTSLVQKALGGLLNGVGLVGDDIIDGWKGRAAVYPERLTRAMVEQYLRFFPLWRFQERLAARDATLWYHQALVEVSQNVLGILAGLNGLYYVPFQFKRPGRFVSRMRFAPERLAARLDSLFLLDRVAAAEEAERLVTETVALVELRLPAIDTSEVRRSLGQRQRPWRRPSS